MQKVQSCFQRVETKYLLTQAQAQAMLRGMRRRVRPDEYSRYTVCNIPIDGCRIFGIRLIIFSEKQNDLQEKSRNGTFFANHKLKVFLISV